MLRSLHVKNLALIRETEVEFGEGLNILTGETGAGKSLLIGSVNLALGGKFEKDMLRRGLRLRGTQTGRKIEKYGSGTFGGRNSDLKQKTVLGEEHLPY